MGRGSVLMATPLPDRASIVDEAAGRLRDLCDRLVAGPSATAVLEAWCREHGASPGTHLVADIVPCPDRPPSSAQRERLELPRDSLVRYRRVRLTCAGRVLSEAENWYVPSRLTAAMNHLLDTSEVPFGRVVHDLAPARRNLGLRLLPAGRDPATAGPDAPLFAIEALLLRHDGLPLCEVAEIYTGAVLAQG